MENTQLTEKAAQIIDMAHVADMTAPGVPGRLYSEEEFEGYAATYSQAGFSWVSFTAATDASFSVEDTIANLAHARRFFQARPDRYVLANTVADIRRARQTGKMAVNLHFQGTNPAAGKLEMLEIYRALGVGHMLIAYNIRNPLGDGCYEAENAGLSLFGRRFVEEMNRVGLGVDCAHTGHRCAMDVIELSDPPAIVSHSNPKRLFDHPRNIEDELIRACADNGGVIGVNGVGMFLGPDPSRADPELLFRQVDHIVQLAGPQHAALGLDYVQNVAAILRLSKANTKMYAENKAYQQTDGDYAFVKPDAVLELTEQMLAAGYSDDDAKGVLGENWLRVFSEIWGD